MSGAIVYCAAGSWWCGLERCSREDDLGPYKTRAHAQEMADCLAATDDPDIIPVVQPSCSTQRRHFSQALDPAFYRQNGDKPTRPVLIPKIP